MKKFAICSLVIALAATIVPKSQAAPRCIHFTNFCDKISFDSISVGGTTGVLLFGEWDWLCTGPGTGTNIIGYGGAKFRLATRPYSAAYSYLSPYSFAFTFDKATHLFDLYGTTGLSGGVAFQLNQPWTQTIGMCLVAKGGTSRPRMVGYR